MARQNPLQHNNSVSLHRRDGTDILLELLHCEMKVLQIKLAIFAVTNNSSLS